ncbi:MAG: efflux RND transporter periplasmic adaptor subunit, partial [Methylocystaceae bacterium]
MSREKGDPLASQTTPKTWRKKVIIALCIVVLGAGGFYVYHTLTPKNTTYLTMPVTTGKISDVVQATGSVKPLQEADLKFKKDGVLQTLNAKTGLTVTLGQQLAVQDDADLRTAVDQAANEITQAQYKLRQSELDLSKVRTTVNRQEALFKEGAISQSDIEQSRNDYSNALISRDMAKASIQSAQVKWQIAQNTLKDAVLSAPFNGIISSVVGEVGQDSS